MLPLSTADARGYKRVVRTNKRDRLFPGHRWAGADRTEADWEADSPTQPDPASSVGLLHRSDNGLTARSQ